MKSIQLPDKTIKLIDECKKLRVEEDNTIHSDSEVVHFALLVYKHMLKS